MNEWMSEWMEWNGMEWNGWINEWVNEWMNGWMDWWINERINEWTHAWIPWRRERVRVEVVRQWYFEANFNAMERQISESTSAVGYRIGEKRKFVMNQCGDDGYSAKRSKGCFHDPQLFERDKSPISGLPLQKSPETQLSSSNCSTPTTPIRMDMPMPKSRGSSSTGAFSDKTSSGETPNKPIAMEPFRKRKRTVWGDSVLQGRRMGKLTVCVQYPNLFSGVWQFEGWHS